MRFTKYRGRTSDGKWLCGDLVHHADKVSVVDKAKLENVPIDFVGTLIVESMVQPETVGQCLDLKDRDGNTIYEGDILRSDKYPYSTSDQKDNYFAEVAWFEDEFFFGLIVW